MANRIADKSIVDEIVRIERKYAKTGDADILDAQHRLATELSESLFGDTYKWCALKETIAAAVGPHGLLPKATNQQIYDILKAYGIDVQDGDAHEA